MPIIPEAALTVNPWMTAAIAVTAMPATGPNANVPMKIGISAGSYYKKPTAGKMGKWISVTSRMEIAANTAREVIVFVLIFIMFTPLKNSELQVFLIHRHYKSVMDNKKTFRIGNAQKRLFLLPSGL